LTVAIPTCNGARHLADALRGILAQQGAAWELLIVDDCSDDDTPRLATALAGDRARLEVNRKRLGLAGNWNRCLEHTATPLVTIFHQDDIMHPGHLASHAAAFQRDPQLGLVASAADLIDAAGNVVAGTAVERGGLGPVNRTFAPGALLPELAVGNPLRCSAVTIRKSAAAEAGGFDPSYRYALDWDFWLRIARHQPIAWLAQPTVAVRWHAASETHRFKAGTTDLDEQIRLLQDLYTRDAATWPNARQLRRAADRRFARAFLNRAHELLKSGDPNLAHRCLMRAVSLSPGILAAIARDPRLTVQMTALAIVPSVSGRFFARGPKS
jgi:GT2 family glycosyltransferase